MSYPELIKDLKNRKFKSVYLLHGEEPYYIDKVSEYVEKGILSEAERGFNQSVFYGKDADLITILNSAKRFPMMSDYQVILVKEAQDLKWGKEGADDKKGADPLLAYLENPVPTTILVFAFKHGKFDKRKKSYKAFEKKGIIFESSPIYDNKLPGWIEEFVKEKGYRMNPQASALMAEYLGNDLSKIANELEKLMLNVPARSEITATDIQNNIGISKEYNVFELQSAIARRDPYKVNQIINYFGANPKSNPIQMVLGNLNTYFTKILRYHYAKDRSQSALAKELGVNPFFVKDYEVAAKSYDRWKAGRVIGYLREIDMKTKGVGSTGHTSDADLLKELLFKIIH